MALSPTNSGPRVEECAQQVLFQRLSQSEHRY
jgi:hypothetical protein